MDKTPNGDTNMTYRGQLQKLERESQRSYDKTVLTLSAGALGVSFAFVRDVVGSSPMVWHASLLASWTLWGLSVTAVLFSFLFSQLALRKAIDQLDAGNDAVNYYDKTTAILNALGGLLFLAGVVAIVVFVAKNLG